MSDAKIKVVFTAAEATPLAKVGGLGDVVGALPVALKHLGVDVRIIIPYYGEIKLGKEICQIVVKDLPVEIKGKKEKISIYKTKLPSASIPVYLIKHNLFSGSEIYGGLNKKNNYKRKTINEKEKFVAFSCTIPSVLRALNIQPDILHLHDWHVAAVLDFMPECDNYFQNTKTVFTIHNLSSQGIIDSREYLNFFDKESAVIIKKESKRGKINLLRQGIRLADAVNTVSPTYAREITTKALGSGLEKEIRKIKYKLSGIINGIDDNFYNPKNDSLIKKKYDYKNLQAKQVNKKYLDKMFGYSNDCLPIVSIVSRLFWQKGTDLVDDRFGRLPCRFIILGKGEKKYEMLLDKLQKKYPDRFKIIFDFNEKLAHQIYAGSDIFLMPSRFEPCGLGQMIAMRYGTVPIVRATGGLADTIIDIRALKNENRNGIRNQESGIGRTKIAPIFQFQFSNPAPNGFIFKKFTADELFKTLNRALDIYFNNPKLWEKIKINGMKGDYSWNKSAKEYLSLYKKLRKE